MIKLPAYFTGFASKTDGSASLRFATQELKAEDFATLSGHHNTFGWLLFKESEIQEEDIPSEDLEEGGISASERLRRVMFVFWKQKKVDVPFDTWRRHYLEKLIENIKRKLE